MSAYGTSWADYNDEEEEELENETKDTESYFSNRDSVLFVIDTSPAMHTKNEEGVTLFRAAIRGLLDFMQHKIISSDSDLLGVMFYGTKQFKNPNGFDNIYVLFDLDTPDVNRIKQLEKIEQDVDKFLAEIGSTEDYAMFNVFWACSTVFSAFSNKPGSKRVFLFTNEDDPNSGDATLQRSARTRADDLHDLKITIELFAWNKPGKPFQFDLFYRDIIHEGEDEDSVFISAMDKVQELTQNIRRKEIKKRSQFRCRFMLYEGFEIAVRGYTLVSEQKKGTYVHVDQRNNKEVKALTTWVCQDTGQLLLPSEIKYYYPYGGEKVVFTKEELAAIKNFGDPGIVLLGFKPKDRLKLQHNLRHSYFIYPDEKEVIGSSSVFIHLLDRMIHLDKIAICRFIPRQNSAPRLVVLVPQKEDGKDTPSGFHVFPLPFADDKRKVPAPEIPDVSEASVDTANKVIGKFALKEYQPEDYENPALQKHYTNLQTLALDHHMADDIADGTLPKTETINKLGGHLVKEFLETFSDDEVSTPAPTPRKRKAAAEDDGSSAKKSKTEVDGDEVQKLAKAGKLSKLTVAQLKAYLDSQGIKAQKKKADLIEQIENHLNV